jgi:hypothetical protein
MFARFLALGLVVPLLMFSGTAGADEAKCVNTVNKNAAKVAKAQAGDNAKCIKDGGNNKLPPGQTIEQCIVSDPKGKVGKAAGKLNEKVGKDCQGITPTIPPIDVSDPNALSQIMIDKELALIHAIFGTDLDEVVAMKDPDKDEWKCQSAVAKAAGKCQDAKLATYNSCKKDQLKGGVASAQALQDACMGTGTGLDRGIPDTKGKIGKKCGNGLGGTLGKKCAGTPNDLFFPPCAGHPVSLEQCLDEKVECEVCLALNALDGLNRDCEEFDNGLQDGSCGGEPECQYTSAPTCGGTCPPGEMCVDTGTCVCQGPAPLDHFRMYLAFGPDAPLVTLEDQFQPQDVDLGPVLYFGVPASKNLEPIFDPEVHMTAYLIPEGGFFAGVDIVNQFGPDSLIIGDPLMLLVPTQKMLGGPVAPVPLVRDHYKCYQVIEQPPPQLPPVILSDQFNPDLPVDVLFAFAFCAPVDKNGEGILSPDEHLTCYQTWDPADAPPVVLMRNQFHEEHLELVPIPEKLLCVPSIKEGVHLP